MAPFSPEGPDGTVRGNHPSLIDLRTPGELGIDAVVHVTLRAVRALNPDVMVEGPDTWAQVCEILGC